MVLLFRMIMHVVGWSILTLAALLLPARPVAAQAVCAGDCDKGGQVTISELILGINILLGFTQVESCRAFDTDGNTEVTVDELIKAVVNAVEGCQFNPIATATATADGPTPTATASPIDTPTTGVTTPASPTSTSTPTATPTIEPPTPSATPQSTSTSTPPHTATATEPPTPTATATAPYMVIDIGGFAVVKAGGIGAVTFSTEAPDVRSVALNVCLDDVFTLTTCDPAVENVTVDSVQPGGPCGVTATAYSIVASGDIPNSGPFIECAFAVSADAAGGDYPIAADATLRDAKGGELAIGSDMALIPVGASVLVFDDLSAAGGDALIAVENGLAFQIDAFCFYSAVDARCGGDGAACRRDQDCAGDLTCDVVECSVTTFDLHFFAFEEVTWPLGAGIDGRVPPAPALPFTGQLVCVELDASGAPFGADSLSGSAAPAGSPRRFRALFNQNGDTTLTFGSAESDAEYEGCPAPDVVTAAVLSDCWSQSGFTFVCGNP